jgi:hypothetical protein
MRLLKVALIYFALVFSAGFFLGALRVLLVAPRLGEGNAELVEMPLMLVVIVLAASRTNRHMANWCRPRARITVGMLALGLLLLVEIGLGTLRGQRPAETLIDRDPVSDTAYYLALGAFALMPWWLGRVHH